MASTMARSGRGAQHGQERLHLVRIENARKPARSRTSGTPRSSRRERPAGRPHDTVLVANLVHYWSPATNAALLGRIHAAVQPGAKLLLADFWTDPTHTQPVQAALMAGEFAAHLREGDVYSLEEVRDWLPAAGWWFVEHVPLANPQSLILAEAV